MSMEGFPSSEGPAVLHELVVTIRDNAAALSEIDERIDGPRPR